MDKEKTILVVDDSKANLTLAKQALDEQYQVSLVPSGSTALRFLEKRVPDLILLDINMPEMDGLETLRRIRETEEGKDIPVIFLTGIGTKESIARVMGLKPQGYVLKTTTREELIKTLRDFFEKQKYKV